MKKKHSSAAMYIVILVLIVFASVALWETGNKGETISYSSFQVKWKQDQIKSIYVHEDSMTVEGIMKNDQKFTTIVPEDFLSQLMVSNPNDSVKVEFEPLSNSGAWLSLIPTILLVVLFLVLLFVLTQQSQSGGSGGRGVMNFGKNRAKISTPESQTVTFKDVAGADEEKQELEEIVDFLKDPKKYTSMGARIPKGVLLVGPPGTGKTLLAKAISGEAGVPFFSISGSDFVEMFVGVGASRVRDLFADAKKNSPCIVFIDEIDAVGRQRGTGVGGGHDEREQTLNQLLVEMDGFGENEGIIMIAATNRADILDPALLRPGRFDRQILVGAPDVKGREEVLKVHTRNKPLAADVNIEVLAKRTPGFAGADLENLANEAALLAVRRGCKEITMNEMEEAITRVVAGPEKKSRVVIEKERKLTAYHEAGHAIVMRSLEYSDPVHEISIIPRGRAGGYTMHLPKEDRSYTSKLRLKDDMVGLLGGRVAEALILGDISTGAKNDIDRTSAIARAMVMEYGMSDKLGTISYSSDSGEVFLGRDIGRGRNFSEEIGAEIDKEVKRFVDEAYERTEKILRENIDKLHAVAEVLLEKEKIDGEEFERICKEA